MAVNEALAREIVRVMNEAAEADPVAIAALCQLRVSCNPELAMHPTIQVGCQHDTFKVGLIGILNGLTGVYDDGPYAGFGPVRAVLNDTWVRFHFVNSRGDAEE